MRQKKAIKKILSILSLIFVLFLFYKINDLNYTKQKQIQDSYVNHPENLPTSEVAKITSFGFKNLRADFYRLKTIQYIGGNVLAAEYKKYLYKIIDLVNNLNPYFEHPYIIGQLLLPDYNYRYEKLDNTEQQKHINEAISIGLKGIEVFCNKEKVELIKNEYDLSKIWKNKEFENPCQSYKIPFYLAYIYYFYNNDPINAAFYYKVSSANKDSLEGSKILAAIMQGKGGDREKAIFMFLTLARSVADEKKIEDKNCLALVQAIGQIKGINGDIIKELEKSLITVFGKFDEKKEKEFLDSNSCHNYVNKSVREINLYYLDEANKKYFKDTGKQASDTKELFKKGYIDYMPKDFQQYKDYGIVYKFNSKTGYFDYEMGDN
ncbi:MAG: hypothetical protein WC850_03500 [Candidatus Gracilibacteria bacterium]